MSRPLLLLLAAFAAGAGCGDNYVVGADGAGDALPFNGGTITVPGCGYTMTTRLGAEAPVVADDHLGPDPTIKHVHLGIAADPRTSIVVTWRTLDDETRAGRVRFGTGGALTQEVTALTFAYQSGIGGVGEQVRIHEAHLCGLTADTEYTYQVVSDDAHVSPMYTFRTAPDIAATPDAEIILASVGDSRDGYLVWAQLVEQLQARTPDLILFSGDAVTIGLFQEEWEEFFAAGEPLFARVPVLSAHGNHELNGVNFYSQFAMPGDEQNFSFDYGHAHITVLNDSPEQNGDLSGKIKDFLRADLTAHQTRPWKLVNHHRPIYSASTRHGTDTTLQTEWAPLYDEFHVDLVLNGHDHNYERTYPMKNLQRQATPADGTIYIVSGGAGAELYGNGMDFWTELSHMTHSALTVRVRSTMLVMDAFDAAGTPIDTLTITKP
ncbi:MAG: metallophosphoesterase family protein [Deltaproteobacteria bacterium]|nr:metallophosphoesterase family protein [Kofleriaceae bacterium]